MEFLKRTQWHSGGPLLAPHVPEATGLYAIGRVSRVMGLTLDVGWVYLGRSVNLRRRVSQHHPIHEDNPGLAEWIHRNSASAEVFYALMPREVLAPAERHAIRNIRPKFNRILYDDGDISCTGVSAA